MASQDRDSPVIGLSHDKTKGPRRGTANTPGHPNRVLLAVFALLVPFLFACDGGGLTASRCPTVLTYPVPPQGTPAISEPASSVNLELGEALIREQMRAMTKPAPDATEAIEITDVRILSVGPADRRRAQLTATFHPKLAKPSPSTPPREYFSLSGLAELTADVVPYLALGTAAPVNLQLEFRRLALVTGSITADLVWRDESGSLHCGADLYNTVGADLLARGVLCKFGFDLASASTPAIPTGSAGQTTTTSLAADDCRTEPAPSIPLPAEKLASLVQGLTGQHTALTGMSFGATAEGIKVGILFDSGSPDTFEPDSLAMRGDFPHGDVDWALGIDTDFLTASIERTARKAMETSHDALRFDFARTEFTSAGIGVFAEGTMQICGDFRIRARSTIKPVVKRNRNGESVLIISSPEPTISNDAKWTQVGCAFIDTVGRTIAGLFAQPLGGATLVVSGPCSGAMEEPIEIVTDDLHLYGTDVSTAGKFLLAGRSEAVDASLTVPRSPVPAC